MSSNPQITIGVSAEDKASAVLQAFDGQVASTTSKVESSSNKIAGASEKAAQKVTKSYAQIATSIAGLIAGIVGFVTSFDTLEKAQTRVDQASLTYQKSLERLKELQTGGKASAQELANAQEQVRLNLEKTKLAQDSLSDTTLNFYANMPSQLIGFGSTAALAFTAFSTGAKGSAISMKTLGHAFKFAMLGPPPIGLILTGVSIAAALVATHFDEISGAIQYAGKVIFDFIDRHFKPLADLIKWFIGGLNSLGAGLKNEAVPAMNDYETSVISATTATAGFNAQVVETQAQVTGLSDSIAVTVTRAKELVQALPSKNEGKIGNVFASEAFSSPMHYSSIAKYGSVENYMSTKDKRSVRIEAERLQNFIRRGGNASELLGYQSNAPNVNVIVNDMGTHYDIEVQSGSASKRLRANKQAIHTADSF